MVSVSHAYIRIYSLSPSVEGKPKRPPTAYNLFVKEHMKNYLAENPGKTNKDAMKHVRPILPLVLLFTHSHFQIGALWKDAPENPRRGQAVKERPPKKAPKRSKKTEPEDSESADGPQVEPGSDE
jgi:hypothetical protein